MLTITGMKRFYFLRDFHDMRCKYDRVLSSSTSNLTVSLKRMRFSSSYPRTVARCIYFVMTVVRTVCMKNVLRRAINLWKCVGKLTNLRCTVSNGVMLLCKILASADLLREREKSPVGLV